MNELDQLRVFVAVVENHSATKAAEKLNVAVSAISRRLQELESQLGVQLLQRTTRKMHLTEAGDLFYRRCRQLLDDLEEAKQAVSLSAKQLTGTLRIATPLSFGISHLTPAIAAFMHLHEGITVQLDMSDRRINLLDEGFDLAIRIGDLEDSSLIARKLAPIDQVVCAAPSFFQRYGEPQTLADLASLPALCYTNLRYPDVWRYRDASGQLHSVKVSMRLSATNGDALREAAIAGLGVLCEPSFILYEAVEGGLLKPVLTEYQWYSMDAYALYPKTRFVSARVRAFIDFLVEYFGKEPYWQQFLNASYKR